MSWADSNKGRPLETYTVRNERGFAEVLVVCKRWVGARFVDAIRIEPLASTLYDGEGKPK